MLLLIVAISNQQAGSSLWLLFCIMFHRFGWWTSTQHSLATAAAAAAAASFVHAGTAFLAADVSGAHVHGIDLSVNMVLAAIERAAAAAAAPAAAAAANGHHATTANGQMVVGGDDAAAAAAANGHTVHPANGHSKADDGAMDDHSPGSDVSTAGVFPDQCAHDHCPPDSSVLATKLRSLAASAAGPVAVHAAVQEAVHKAVHEAVQVQQAPHDVTFEVADVLTRDFAECSFDAVISRDALLHVPAADKGTLFNRCRLLRSFCCRCRCSSLF